MGITMIKNRTISRLAFDFMLMPGVLLILIYSYLPMIGFVIAFEDFNPGKGMFKSAWVGLKNFNFMFELPNTISVISNTIFIASMKIIVGLIVPIVFSLLLNEIRKSWYKRSIQTIVYLPHFLSWVILGGILVDILSPSNGLVNVLLNSIGIKSIYFLGDNNWFPYVVIISNEWKEFGFSTIVFLAALTGINPTLYEAAVIDGANRWKQTLHITLPGMLPIILLVTTLSIGNVLNAGFDQIFNLYSPQVYESGDILDTFVYRVGLLESRYDLATAIGLMKSIVSFGFISFSYYIAYRCANYRIF